MSTLQKQLLDRIAKEGARPLPRWVFRLRTAAWWAALAAVILVAGLSAGIFLELLRTADWEILPHFPGGALHFFWLAAGAGWLLLLAAATAAGGWIYRQTPHGYRTASLIILLLTFVVAGVLGAAFTATRISERAANFHEQHFRPLFENFAPPARRGVLEGELLSAPAAQFAVRDFAGSRWQINGTRLPPAPPRGYPAVGSRVRVLGQGDFATHTFRAVRLRPLHTPPRTWR